MFSPGQNYRIACTTWGDLARRSDCFLRGPGISTWAVRLHSLSGRSASSCGQLLKNHPLHFTCHFASPAPPREFTPDHFRHQDRSAGLPDHNDPEHVVPITKAPRYKLGEHTHFCNLFAGRFGSVAICGGYGEFDSGSSLPCHFHQYDESITIVRGEAICEIMEQSYRLSGYGTAAPVTDSVSISGPARVGLGHSGHATWMF
jgi:quercetin dioxygenase-like cupin family protein